MIRPPRKSHQAPTRAGFTLIEMTIAIALTGIVSAGLMSALLFSLRAIPSAGDPGLEASRLDAASEFFLADAMLASAVTGSNTELTLTVPDQTGDAAADTVVYTYDSGTLTRAINGGDKRPLADNLASGRFSAISIDSKVVTVTATFKLRTGRMHRVSAECLARPEVE